MGRFKGMFFSREEPILVYDALRSIPDRVIAAVGAAVASGPPETAAERLDLSRIQHDCTIAVLTLQSTHERAVARVNSMDKAKNDADRRVRTALRDLVSSSIDNDFDPRGYFVYVLWGADEDRPLYVGKSTNVLARLGSHMSDNVKRQKTRRVSLVQCQTARQMDATEQRLITEYRPLLNIVGNKAEAVAS